MNDEELANALIGRLGTRDTVQGIIMLAFKDERARCAGVCSEIAELDKQESASDSARRCAEAILRSGEIR